MKTLRTFIIGALVGVLALATPVAQASIINLTNDGWLVAPGNAVPLLLGSNGKGFIKISETGAITFINSGSATFLAADGSASAPSYSFASDPDLGLYLSSAGVLGVSVDGVIRARFQSGAFDLITDSMALRFGAGADVSLSRGAANRLDLATGDDFYVVNGAIGIGTVPSVGSGSLQTSGTITSGAAINATSALRLNAGSGAGSATSSNKIIKKVTGIADAVATDVFTVTVPNANHGATVCITFLSSNGSTDAFESSRTAIGCVVLTRTTGVATVATAVALTNANIATVAAGATHTLAYDVSAMTGAVGATQTFTIRVTIDDSGNLGSNQVVAVAELVNAEATGVTIS